MGGATKATTKATKKKKKKKTLISEDQSSISGEGSRHLRRSGSGGVDSLVSSDGSKHSSGTSGCSIRRRGRRKDHDGGCDPVSPAATTLAGSVTKKDEKERKKKKKTKKKSRRDSSVTDTKEELNT